MKYKIIILILLSVVLFNGLLDFVQAQTTFEVGIPGQTRPGEPFPTYTDTEGREIVDIERYIAFLYMFMIGLVGIAGFASLVWYGIVWIYSGIAEKKSEAMEGIKNTLIGISLALGSFVILNTINPALVTLTSPKFPELTAKPANEMPKEIAVNNRIAGNYYYKYKDDTFQNRVVYRYSKPFSSLSLCNNARDTFTEICDVDNDINCDSDTPDPEAFPCESYKIGEKNNYFYWAKNKVTNEIYVSSGFTDQNSCEKTANDYGITSLYKIVNKPASDVNCQSGEPPSNAIPLP